ncbi:hypothetical protein R8871_05719 [Paraburkholderia graminis C4D1M]|uniref:Transmembrane protein n=2 Tax=Paraburkholderia graminis TaxID=60548 RepID=B1FTL5_PARG4|nr:hypothetical protein BgramDRAFT_0341 [Paraburkholderia graminis C4D1M]CAB3730850.1 hypothetical protein R8871_05719 [Paraburkholderia graminis C4D1M]
MLRLNEDYNGVTASYSRGSQWSSALCIAAAAMALALVGYAACVARPSLLSEGWLLVPVCLLGFGVLLHAVVHYGVLRSPIHITASGAVRQAFWTWRYPGPFTATCVKVTRKVPRFKIELHYAGARQRFAGSESEGDTIGVAVRLDAWSRSRITDDNLPQERRRSLSQHWLIGGCVFTSVCLPIVDYLLDGDRYYLDGLAPYGGWARSAMAVFAALGTACLIFVVAQWFARPVRANAAVWLSDIAAAVLLIAGSTTVVGHYAQSFEMRIAPAQEYVYERPFQMEMRDTRKGCKRFLVVQEPTLRHAVKVCDTYDAQYWSGATAVLVHQSISRLGVHIGSIGRTR